MLVLQAHDRGGGARATARAPRGGGAGRTRRGGRGGIRRRLLARAHLRARARKARQGKAHARRARILGLRREGADAGP